MNQHHRIMLLASKDQIITTKSIHQIYNLSYMYIPPIIGESDSIIEETIELLFCRSYTSKTEEFLYNMTKCTDKSMYLELLSSIRYRNQSFFGYYLQVDIFDQNIYSPIYSSRLLPIFNNISPPPKKYKYFKLKG